MLEKPETGSTGTSAVSFGRRTGSSPNVRRSSMAPLDRGPGPRSAGPPSRGSSPPPPRGSGWGGLREVDVVMADDPLPRAFHHPEGVALLHTPILAALDTGCAEAIPATRDMETTARVAPSGRVVRGACVSDGDRRALRGGRTVRPCRRDGVAGDACRLGTLRVTEAEQCQRSEHDPHRDHRVPRVERDRRDGPPAVRVQQDRAERLTLEQGVGLALELCGGVGVETLGTCLALVSAYVFPSFTSARWPPM